MCLKENVCQLSLLPYVSIVRVVKGIYVQNTMCVGVLGRLKQTGAF